MGIPVARACRHQRRHHCHLGRCRAYLEQRVGQIGIRRRAIILLTDGLDTASRLQQREAINRTLGAEAVVYVIGIGSKRYGVDRDSLRELAQRTGGRAFFPDKNLDETPHSARLNEAAN